MGHRFARGKLRARGMGAPLFAVDLKDENVAVVRVRVHRLGWQGGAERGRERGVGARLGAHRWDGGSARSLTAGARGAATQRGAQRGAAGRCGAQGRAPGSPVA